MGVLRYFKYIYDNYQSSLIHILENNNKDVGISSSQTLVFKNVVTTNNTVNENTKVNIKMPVCNFLAFDLNSLIHPICQKAYNYNQPQNNKFKKFKKPQIKYINPHIIYQQICDKIYEIIKLLNPTNEIYIAIDGVAGMSKINQQRKRRFTSVNSKSVSELQKFDSNCISAGTIFMDKCSKYIHFWIVNTLKPLYPNVKIIFSNEKVIGEAEHKIIRYIQNNYIQGYNYFVQSPDADLIMLLLGLNKVINNKLIHLNNLWIFRENIYNFIDTKYFLVDIDDLYKTTINMLKFKNSEAELTPPGVFKNATRGDSTGIFKNSTGKNKFDEFNAIVDYILMIQFTGNDFLPTVPSMELVDNNLNNMFEIYKGINNHLTRYNIVNNKPKFYLRRKSLYYWFYKMAQTESNMLYLKSTKRLMFPDLILNECINNNVVDIQKYRNIYYKKKINNENIQDMCNQYFSKLTFVLRYYLNEIPDWRYVYKYHYAPFFNEMYKNIKNFDSKCKFNKNTPLSNLQQLISILPTQSINLLPTELQPLFYENSSIIHMYPSDFIIDNEGKKTEHESIIILPFVDDNLLLNEFNKITLSETSKKLNINGKVNYY